MHWVDRGPEPPGLPPIRARYTPGWVDHRDGFRSKPPSDTRWRRFRNELQAAFGGLCGYCEELCRGEIDHFQPKDRFPELVYSWSNWIWACHACNHAKGNKWPRGGYLNPCARSMPARPENFLDFDLPNGLIQPKDGLSPARRRKVQQTIDDLRLNAKHHRRGRVSKASAISLILSRGLQSNPTFADWLKLQAARSEPLSSVARAVMAQYGYSPD